VISVEPLTGITFRKPGPFGLTQRGPLSVSSTYFMKTTTLLGLLAYTKYSEDPSCAEAPEELPLGFSALASCLPCRPLRGPYASVRSQLYFGEERPFNLSALLELWEKGLKEEVEGLAEGRKVLEDGEGLMDYYAKSPDFERVSIISNKLDRRTKRSAFVFVRERLIMSGVEFFFEEEGCGGVREGVYALGSDGGLARVRRKPSNPVEGALKELWGERWGEPGAKATVVAVSPIILGFKDPHDPRSHWKGALRDAAPVRLFSRYEVELHPLGWDMKRNCPRPFAPAIKPGSAVVGTLEVSPEELYWRGVGELAELGFGSVLPLPM